MIKLIASDLDGSLLDDEKNAPRDFARVISRLNEKGITFVAASGRNYHATAPALNGLAEQMICICNNGANIYENGQLIISHSLTKEQVGRTLDIVKGIENTSPLIFTLDKCYAAPGCKGFMEWAKNPYSPLEWLDSYEDLYDIADDVFKISVFDGSGDITNHSFPPLKNEFFGCAAVYISGEVWVDVVNTKASKGEGIQQIQKMLGIKKEETMAFGDYYNDESLLDNAAYPFVMEKGVDRLKEKFPLRAGDNNSGGVTKTIKSFVLGR